MDLNVKNQWEKLWRESKGGVYQSWEWAMVKETIGDKPIFITIGEDNISAGVVLFESTIKTAVSKKKIIYVQGNPLYKTEEKGEELLKKIKDESKKYFYCTISPNVLNKNDEIFLKSGYHKISNHTILINLDREKEELWKNLEKKSIRWGVNTAEKNGLKFETAQDKEIDDFYEIYRKTAEDGKFNYEKKEFLENLSESSIAKLFVVKNGEKVVAGGMILLDENNKITTLDLTGASEEGLKLQAMPFLYWNIILYSKEKGFKSFDLGGYDMEARQGDKTYNINKYKERFGGEITEQPIFSSNAKYIFFRKLIKRMRFVKKLYKKSKD